MSNPVKISPSPIIEASVEIRFESDVKSAVIFGRLYGKLAEKFNETEELPILAIPADMLAQNPELRYAPHYRLTNKKYAIGIGPNALSINRVCEHDKYESWDSEYSPVVTEIVTSLVQSEIIKQVNAVSVKYINFFQDETLDVISSLSLKIKGEDYLGSNALQLNVVEENGDIGVKYTLTSNANVSINNSAQKTGSVIDIHAITKNGISISNENILPTVEKLHMSAESSFWKALNDDYLKSSLNPIYE